MSEKDKVMMEELKDRLQWHIRQVLIDEGLNIVKIGYMHDYERKNEVGITAIVQALLTSEEIEILDKRDIQVIGEPFRKED